MLYPFAFGYSLTIPDAPTPREVRRVGEKLFKDVVNDLHMFPAGFRKRAAGLFCKVYEARLQQGKKPIEAKRAGVAEINRRKAETGAALKLWGLGIDSLYSAEARASAAHRVNVVCRGLLRAADGDPFADYERIAAYLISQKITPPQLYRDGSNVEPCILRMACADWLARRVEVQARRVRELLSIAWGDVTAKKPYCSDYALNEQRGITKAADEYLKTTLLINDETENYCTMQAASGAGASNPFHRVIELNVRVDGIAEAAERAGMKGYFVTATAPSRMHYNSRKYDGTTPKEAQAYLVHVWARVRARFAKHEINFRGLRVVEPHKDATPHWHILAFFSEWQAAQAVEIMRQAFSAADAHELTAPKAARARFDAVRMENPKHAARYVAKYIQKNIDGRLRDPIDYETDLSSEDAAERVTTWSRVHGVRQFQFFGVAAVGLWREIRRIQAADVCERVQKLIDATGGRRGDDLRPNWCEFERLAEGVSLLKKEAFSRYGELKRRVFGVSFDDHAEFVTRAGDWVRERVTEGMRSALKTGGSLFAWKVVNNCNPSAKERYLMTDSGQVLQGFFDGRRFIRGQEWNGNGRLENYGRA